MDLSDGHSIPTIGFGCYDGYGEEMVRAVRTAAETGYRYFDSAERYRNEKEVGKGLTEELDKILDKVNNAWDKKQQDRQKLHEQRQKEIADYNKQSMADFLAEQEEEADEAAELWLESYRKQTEAAEESAQKRIAVMNAYASGTSDLLGSIADLMEESGSADEKSVKAAKKAFTAKWKKVTGASGYQLSYKTGKKTKKVLVKGAAKVSKKVKKLQSKKQYTVKVRAYKLVNGRKYWGKWSAGKKVKVR
jgi:hypothetical protein